MTEQTLFIVRSRPPRIDNTPGNGRIMAPVMTTELSLVEFAFDAAALSVLACHDTQIA